MKSFKNFIKNCDTQPTKEMIDHFEKCTKLHINLVKKYGKKLGLDLTNHDKSKFKKDEYIPYIYISWFYKETDYIIPDEWNERCDNAWKHHIKNNKHHPEYWDENLDLSSKKIVNGIGMPTEYLMEMCCDWQSISKELGTSVYQWANSTINVRWSFNSGQVEFIYDILDKLNT